MEQLEEPLVGALLPEGASQEGALLPEVVSQGVELLPKALEILLGRRPNLLNASLFRYALLLLAMHCRTGLHFQNTSEDSCGRAEDLSFACPLR